jgi:hypothetical protein
MPVGGILFFFRKELRNVARCFNRSTLQPSISTASEPDLRIAVDSRLGLVEGRYHVTAWSRFYPFFITLIKYTTEEAQVLARPCRRKWRNKVGKAVTL